MLSQTLLLITKIRKLSLIEQAPGRFYKCLFRSPFEAARFCSTILLMVTFEMYIKRNAAVAFGKMTLCWMTEWQWMTQSRITLSKMTLKRMPLSRRTIIRMNLIRMTMNNTKLNVTHQNASCEENKVLWIWPLNPFVFLAGALTFEPKTFSLKNDKILFVI